MVGISWRTNRIFWPVFFSTVSEVLCFHTPSASPLIMLTQESSLLFHLPPPFMIRSIEILSFQELTVLLRSKQEWILNSPEIIFQVGGSVSIGGLLEWTCGGSMCVCVWKEGVCFSGRCAVVPHTRESCVSAEIVMSFASGVCLPQPGPQVAHLLWFQSLRSHSLSGH